MTDTQTFEPDGRAILFGDEGEGPVKLVLIQEAGFTADVLSVVSHYLAEEAGFHVLRIGHRAGDATLDERVQDAIDVIDAAGLEDAWIGGHGFGGTIARALVAAHPERANGLLLLGVEDVDIPVAPAIPVLIVQGTDDTVTPAANAERLQATVPDRSSIKTIAGDHLFPVHHPIDTGFIIEEYLDWD